MHFLDRFIGDPAAAFIKSQQKTIARINELEPAMRALTDAEITEKTASFKSVLAEKLSGERDPLALLEAKDRVAEKKRVNTVLNQLLPEAFALVREASRRAVGQRHFDVQLIGGIVLQQGDIAEMRTGEGKTLVATLPLYLNALVGRGAHLVTANDYLAKVGVLTYGSVYALLGLTVGVVTHDQSSRFENGELVPVTRKEAYACDITYGTNNEFGFDYLRDNMAQTLDQMVQRELYYALVDEVDSILIDEGRSPLIISAPAEESGDDYMRFAQLIPRLTRDVDYTVDEKDRAASLTPEGITKVEQLLGVANVYSAETVQLAYHLEESLKAAVLYKRDKDYVVRDGEVIIVDEFTGRLMPGRRYSEGLHQAIEAKEGVVVQRESMTMATISFQNLFRLYTKLGGMTGTAKTEAEEFMKIYGLEVYTIPTNRPMVRQDMADRVYKTEKGKYQAVVQEVKQRTATGQPVLIGTASIEKNELLGELLTRAGVKHEILNAKNNEREASIIAEAGRKGAVTLATNLAGRGTDIVLGGVPPKSEVSAQYEAELAQWQKDHDEVVALGGLHVLGTERHEARRIDNQLRGRAGRQGDPGSSQFYVSTEDDLMRIFGGDRMKGWLTTMGVPDDEAFEHKMLSNFIEAAQKRVEGHNFDMRKRVVEYDDVMNRQREVIYKKRYKALVKAGDVSEIEQTIHQAIAHQARHLASVHTQGERDAWTLDQLVQSATSVVGLSESESQQLLDRLNQFQSDSAIESQLSDLFQEVFSHKHEEFGVAYNDVLRQLYLRSIDTLWVEHLTVMNELRTGIGLQGYAQTDPLIAYKAEGFRLFQQLIQAIEQHLLRTVFWTRVEIQSQPPTESPTAAA